MKRMVALLACLALVPTATGAATAEKLRLGYLSQRPAPPRSLGRDREGLLPRRAQRGQPRARRGWPFTQPELNCGVEGPTDHRGVRELRARQVRNFLATLFLSQGVPMLLARDEFGHTQSGNNNAYCQDNELTWIDWRLAEQNAALVGFVRRLADLRRSRLWLRRDTFLKGTRRSVSTRDIAWLHPSGREMTDHDWNDGSLRCLALQMSGTLEARVASHGDLLAVFNADDAGVEMVLPQAAHGSAWRVVIDTGRPEDDGQSRVLQCKESLRLAPHAVALLESSGIFSDC